MIRPNRFQEICDKVFSKDKQYGMYCSSGYKKIYDEDTGEFLGNLLVFQAASFKYDLGVGPIFWDEDYFQKEEQVVDFAESIMMDARQWLS